MNDELKAKLLVIFDKAIYGFDRDDIPDMIAQIDQAYQEENHTTALIWYERLLNDLINDDELKHSGQVGRILEYARIAAGLSEEDVKITLPNEYIPHDPDFVAEHISPVLEVKKDDVVIMPSASLPPDWSTSMTADEFLSRFTQELNADKHLMTPGAYKHALEIAKRAAGQHE